MHVRRLIVAVPFMGAYSWAKGDAMASSFSMLRSIDAAAVESHPAPTLPA
jgi:hypothetical protein